MCRISPLKNLTLFVFILLNLSVQCLGEPEKADANLEVNANQVYKIVDQLSSELLLIHENNESQPILNPIPTSNRQPRHVYYKAREVYERLQILRFINGLEKNVIPGFPTVEIAYSQILELVEMIYHELRELKQIYDANNTIENKTLTGCKTSTDIYQQLVLVENYIDGLNIPPVVANDVYPLAMAAYEDIKLLASHHKYKIKHQPEFNKANAQTTNVYYQARTLLLSLQQLCQRKSSSCPQQGISIPGLYNRPITPAILMDLLNNIMADINSMKIAANIKSPTILPNKSSGKTPSHIYVIIRFAYNIIQRL